MGNILSMWTQLPIGVTIFLSDEPAKLYAGEFELAN
jgi:hypothetical protein